MLQVDVNKIIPLTEARDSLNKIVDDVDNTDEMYVITKNGTPTAVIVGVNHLEKLTNEKLPDGEKTEKEPENKPEADMPVPPPAQAAPATATADDPLGVPNPASPISNAPATPPSDSTDQAEANTVQAASPADDLFNDFSDINQPPEGGSPLGRPADQPAGSASGSKSIFDDDDAPEAPAPVEPATSQTPAEPAAAQPTPQAMTYDDFIAGSPQNEPAAETTGDNPPSQFEVPAPTPTDTNPTPPADTAQSDEPADAPPQSNPVPDPNPIASTPPSHPNYTYGSSNQGTSASSSSSNTQQPNP